MSRIYKELFLKAKKTNNSIKKVTMKLSRALKKKKKKKTKSKVVKVLLKYSTSSATREV